MTWLPPPGRVRSKKNAKQRICATLNRRSSCPSSACECKPHIDRIESRARSGLERRQNPSDAAWRRVEPFPDADAARARYFTVDEAKRLINASDPDFCRLVQAALVTGARYSELARFGSRISIPIVARFTFEPAKWQGTAYRSERGGAALLNRSWPGKRKTLSCWRRTTADLGKSSPGSADGQKRVRGRRSNPGVFSYFAAHLGFVGRSGRRPPFSCRAQPRSPDTRMVEKHYGHLAPSYIVDAIRAAAPKFGTSLSVTWYRSTRDRNITSSGG